jgi:hypothetical protein
VRPLPVFDDHNLDDLAHAVAPQPVKDGHEIRTSDAGERSWPTASLKSASTKDA